MQRTEPPLIAAAVCLAALGGFVDALAFMSLGGFFASFMSGNSTRLGVGLATGAGADVTTAGALILSFVSGVILATVIARARPKDSVPAMMAAVTLLLLLAAAAGSFAPPTTALLVLAIAMGAVHLMLYRERDAIGGLASLTGSLVGLGERLAGALMGDPDRWGWLHHLLLWSGFAAGVVLGAGSYLRFDAGAYWIPAAAAAALTLRFASTARASRQPSRRGFELP